jgi:mannose-6-phosphate isomerase-like protein (cupin superfamily)
LYTIRRMKWSRRELSFLLPALAAAQTPAQKKVLPSHAYRFDDLPAHKSGPGTMRQVLRGTTHTGCPIDLHETELPAGASPHPPHHHVWEEMMMIRDGLVEITIEGQSTRLGPGGVAYVASNQVHGLHNVGSGPARYFVLAFR